MADDNPISAAYVKITDAANYLSISEVSIRRAVQHGYLPHVRFGRSVRIALTDLDAFAAAHRVTGGESR
ncbi:helix-turn-helix domain-containing protein [Amycolatopsis sp. NPDC052450]|uniref:helix-turn-helix domain-containing protein n=1 Tax=Amycolatopsis sp. NPDC052450 TaxID=3363937 RepID=UPI0037CB10BF